MTVEQTRLLTQARRLGPDYRSPRALAAAIGHYFDGIPVEIEDMQHRPAAIPADRRCRLGMQATRLGLDQILGECIDDIAGKFRICLGPLDRPAFDSFLPGGARFDPLRTLLHLILRAPLEWELVMELDPAAGVPWHLGRSQASPSSDPGLGKAAWLGRSPARPWQARLLASAPN
jgi:type VI secretion system protein ImpH